MRLMRKQAAILLKAIKKHWQSSGVKVISKSEQMNYDSGLLIERKVIDNR